MCIAVAYFQQKLAVRANVTESNPLHSSVRYALVYFILSLSRSPRHRASILLQSRRNSPFNLSSFSRSRFCLIIVCQRARDDDDFNKQLFYLIKYVPLIKYFSCWFRCFLSHSFARSRPVLFEITISHSKCTYVVCVRPLVFVSGVLGTCTYDGTTKMDLIGAQENYAE